MSTTIELLDQSAPRAARTVALELLSAAAHARTRLDDPSDADALHHFRVSLRRLRSWLRALEPWLEGSTSKKALRRLKKAARITTESRDAEVHLEWLHAQRPALSVRQRLGLAWLVEKIEAEKRRSDRAVAAKGVRRFERAHATLSRKLPIYRAHVDESRNAPESCAGVMAALLHDEAAVLARRLAALESFDDTKAVHAARIAGKRLRYLLEPIAGHVEGAPRLVADLEQLQDALGDWHDANVFSTAIAEMSDEIEQEDSDPAESDDAENGASSRPRRDARAGNVQLGLLALAGRLQERGRKAFASLRERSADATTLLDEVEAVVRALTERRGHDQEIERKYLLSALPDFPDDVRVAEIEQGYLPGTRVHERLRHVRFADGAERYYRTVKSGQGVARLEIEDEIPRAFFDDLWPLTKGRRLSKRRYAVKEDDYTWEVDAFVGRDLVLAEVELTRADDEPPPPFWLKSLIDREVTGDPRYDNATLASGDRSVSEQMREEKDQAEQREPGRGVRTDDARTLHERSV